MAGLVGTAPDALNAIYELAAALGDDPNFAATVNTAIAARLTQDQGDIRYRQLSALIGTADLGFDPATQVELNDAISARIAADNLRALLTDKRFNQIVPPVNWWVGVPGVPTNLVVNGNSFVYMSPVILRQSITIDQLWHRTTVAGGAGGFIELLVYNDNGDFYPGALLAQANVPTDVVGLSLLNITPTVLPAGPIWLGARVNMVGAAATVMGIFGGPAGSLFPPAQITAVSSHYGGGHVLVSSTSAPNPFPPSDTAFSVINGVPRILMRRSA